MTDSTAQRAELALFLRSRRERLGPAEVGLSESGRRRTPGLRREEVAQLADVGVSWYTWLEQGRDIHVSEPLLERLAGALRLSATERTHLFALAHGRPPTHPTITTPRVSDALQRIIDAYVYPALVSNRRWDTLAWNAATVILYDDFGNIPPRERNSLWQMFTNPDRRCQMPGWELDARRAVANFRLHAARAADRSEFDTLVKDLSSASLEFARMWNEHDVSELPGGTKRVLHASVGIIEFEHVALTYAEPDGNELRVALYNPLPGESATRAKKLFKL